MSNTDETGTALYLVLTPILYSGVCIGQGWQKSGKYWEIRLILNLQI
jgi:hypothetical protein